jgi:F-type H+-transporting ATPase subunit a
MMSDPLEQFKIYNILPIRIGCLDISMTNSSLWMLLSVLSFVALGYLSVNKKTLVPNFLQISFEKFVVFVEDMTQSYIGELKPYFFPVFALFVFVAFSNILGLIPHSFTVTSQIIVTFTLSFIVFFASTLLGFLKHGVGFFSFFIPKDLPFYMIPLLFVIEVISYFFRPISLAVRLFANMMAGHVILKIFLGFSGFLGVFWGLFPACISVVLFGFEAFIAILQSYVFALLTCLYIRDAIYLH